MTKRTMDGWRFPAVKRRKVEVDFAGGDITSDAGALLVRQMDERLNLTQNLARVLPDGRRQNSCKHSLRSLLRQRIYALACGYEDGNDHLRLRHDPALQTAVGTTEALGSPATLCRLENALDKRAVWRMHEVFMQTFIRSHESPPKELVLDFDATDIAVHGDQEGRGFHAFYDHYCFLPLYVFCGEQLLVAYLRPSKIDAAKHAWGILALLVKRLRREWPGVRLIFRGDSGFCRHRMLEWCDKNDVGYVVGIARNKVLERLAAPHLAAAKAAYEETGEKQTLFAEDVYAAGTWQRERRLIIKAEHLPKGANPRFLVTNLTDAPEVIYREDYCPRGDMENRIKEQQLDLFAHRTSCQAWWANQCRVLLAGCAYILLQHLRATVLPGTELARASCGSIRLKLLKIGAVVIRNTRRIRLHLSSSYPHISLFRHIVSQLCLNTS